ncbi:MAG: glycosyl hydrolase [Gemmatimonas sp.]
MPRACLRILLVSALFGPSLARTQAAPDSDAFGALAFRGIGPGLSSGRVADVAVDPRNRSIWYVATASGGLWKTQNRGLTFVPIFEHGAYSMSAVLVDPRNSKTIWLATGENTNLRSAMAGQGMFKSTDAGATWKFVGLGLSEKIGRIAIDPSNSDVVYVAAQGPLWAAGGERGLYKTTNGGVSWSRVLHVSENTGISDVVIDPRTPNTLYAASYQRRRNVGILIGGGPEGAIYKSTDGGTNWRKLAAGLPTVDIGRIGLALSPQNPDVVYATIAAQGTSSGFFRSADRGETWVKQSDWVSGDPQYYGELFADPHHFDWVYAIASDMSMTKDGGKTFGSVPARGVHVDFHHVGFDPTDSLYLMLGNDGGIYDSYDNGVTWRHYRIPVTQFYRVSADNAQPFYNIYGGAQDNGTMGTPSRSLFRGGIRESEILDVAGGDGFQPRADPEDPNTIYALSQDGSLQRVNKLTGENKSIRAPRVMPDSSRVRWHWDVPLLISPFSHTRVYILGSRLFRSDDRGDTWTAVSPDLTRQLNRDTISVMGRRWGPDAVNRNLYTHELSVGIAFDESPKKEGLLVVGTDDGLIQISDDGGKAWRKTAKFPGVPELTYVSEVLASRHDANVIYAAFNNQWRGDFTPYLLRSRDQGRTWTSIRGNLPDRNQIWTLAEDTENPALIFAGTELGLYVTTDGGKVWRPWRSGLPTIPVRDIEVQRRDGDLVLGTFGRGIYVLDDYTPLRTFANAAQQSAPTLFAPRPTPVYLETPLQNGGTGNGGYTAPNPAFGALLTFYLPQSFRLDVQTPAQELVLAVSDATGSAVAQLPVTVSSGLQRAVWNLRKMTLPPRTDNVGGGRGGFGGGGRGGANLPLVAPGNYTVQLFTRAAGKLVTPIGAPQRLQVVPLQ